MIQIVSQLSTHSSSSCVIRASKSSTFGSGQCVHAADGGGLAANCYWINLNLRKFNYTLLKDNLFSGITKAHKPGSKTENPL